MSIIIHCIFLSIKVEIRTVSKKLVFFLSLTCSHGQNINQNPEKKQSKTSGKGNKKPKRSFYNQDLVNKAGANIKKNKELTPLSTLQSLLQEMPRPATFAIGGPLLSTLLFEIMKILLLTSFLNNGFQILDTFLGYYVPNQVLRAGSKNVNTLQKEAPIMFATANGIQDFDKFKQINASNTTKFLENLNNKAKERFHNRAKQILPNNIVGSAITSGLKPLMDKDRVTLILSILAGLILIPLVINTTCNYMANISESVIAQSFQNRDYFEMNYAVKSYDHTKMTLKRFLPSDVHYIGSMVINGFKNRSSFISIPFTILLQIFSIASSIAVFLSVSVINILKYLLRFIANIAGPSFWNTGLHALMHFSYEAILDKEAKFHIEVPPFESATAFNSLGPNIIDNYKTNTIPMIKHTIGTLVAFMGLVLGHNRLSSNYGKPKTNQMFSIALSLFFAFYLYYKCKDAIDDKAEAQKDLEIQKAKTDAEVAETMKCRDLIMTTGDYNIEVKRRKALKKEIKLAEASLHSKEESLKSSIRFITFMYFLTSLISEGYINYAMLDKAKNSSRYLRDKLRQISSNSEKIFKNNHIEEAINAYTAAWVSDPTNAKVVWNELNNVEDGKQIIKDISFTDFAHNDRKYIARSILRDNLNEWFQGSSFANFGVLVQKLKPDAKGPLNASAQSLITMLNQPTTYEIMKSNLDGTTNELDDKYNTISLRNEILSHKQNIGACLFFMCCLSLVFVLNINFISNLQETLTAYSRQQSQQAKIKTSQNIICFKAVQKQGKKKIKTRHGRIEINFPYFAHKHLAVQGYQSGANEEQEFLSKLMLQHYDQHKEAPTDEIEIKVNNPADNKKIPQLITTKHPLLSS